MNTARTTISDASVWQADSFPTARAWVHAMDDAMRDDVTRAVEEVNRQSIPWHAVERSSFPLPHLGPVLEAMAAELEDGPGFSVLGGFDVSNFSRDDNRTAFCGISAWLGRVVSQTHRGERIIDVLDIGKPYDHTSRGYSSNRLLPFHTDGADLAGLHCLGEAAQGGESIIVSAPMVYNVLLDEFPEALAVLERGFFHHRRGEQGPGEAEISSARIPVFSFYDGLLHTMYNRNPIDWVRHAGLELSDAEVDALDTLDAVLARPNLQLRMEMKEGDLQFINNFVTFHSRTEYEDGAGHRRHLQRIWLENVQSRRTGPTLLDLYAPDESRVSSTLD